MTPDKTVESSRRFYAHLLRLYPQEFRDEYGSSMLQLFTDQCRSTVQQNGTRGMMFLWFRTLGDLVLSVLRERIASPRASWGLLEAIPNKPLPWKGVALVLIPCLVFFIGQLGQLAGQDWFFLLVRRAAYYLIIPVLLVWLLTRKFPVWGLIPLGIFYRTLFDVSYRIEYILSKSFSIIFESPRSPLARLWQTYPAVTKILANAVLWLQKHPNEIKILATTFLLATTVFLIIRIVRRRGFARSAWAWLGIFLVLTMMETLSGFLFYLDNFKMGVSEFIVFQDISSILRDIGFSAYSNFTFTIGFLLLILIGGLLARRHGRMALLLPLGYLIPTVVLGRFDNSPDMPYSLFWISVSVLAFRVLVTLVAPIWIVRSASERAQKRAGAIALPVAVGILVLAHAGYLIASMAAYGWNLGWMSYYSFSPDLIILAGIALAITLYRSAVPVQSVAGQTPALAEITSG